MNQVKTGVKPHSQVLGLCTGCTFRSTDHHHGLHPISRIYPSWIYKSDHYPHSGHYRCFDIGTEKRSNLRICIWNDKFDQ